MCLQVLQLLLYDGHVCTLFFNKFLSRFNQINMIGAHFNFQALALLD